MTATQIQKLMQRDVLIYPAQGNALLDGNIYPADGSSPYSIPDTDREQNVVQWVWQNRKRAGATTQKLSKSKTAVSCHPYRAADLRCCRDSDGKANAA
ncbi:MAG: hypothetical protein ACLR8P_21915 [Clostridium fessum]